jgi:hypothetical protein
VRSKKGTDKTGLIHIMKDKVSDRQKRKIVNAEYLRAALTKLFTVLNE